MARKVGVKVLGSCFEAMYAMRDRTIAVSKHRYALYTQTLPTLEEKAAIYSSIYSQRRRAWDED